MKPIVPAPSRAKSIEGSGPCAVCEGGWLGYWRTILSGGYAPICDDHIRENAESARLAEAKRDALYGACLKTRPPAESPPLGAEGTDAALSATDELNSLTKQLPIGEHQAGGDQ